MTHSEHGIVRDERGQEQPADKERAQTAPQTRPDGSVTREATRDPKHDDPKHDDPAADSRSDR